MRRIINISVLLVMSILIWSCERIDAPSMNGAINFSTATLTTKADPVNMPAGDFTVAGKYCSGSTWSGTSATDVFGGLQGVTSSGSGTGGSACTYSPLKYWKGNSIYRFRAVSPIAPDQVSYTDDLNGNAVISNFSVNASASSQKDLMLSELVERTTSSPVGTQTPVSLLFHHLLCKVTVKINEDTSTPNADLDVFTITGVKLNGLPDRGTYTGTSNTGTWSTSGAQGLTCINNTNYAIDNDGAYTTVFNGLLLIPMTITNQVNMVLDYKVSHNGGEATTKSAVISIPAITWEAGKVYTYQLSMSEEYYIRFGNITVDPWGSTQSSGSVIIK